MTLRKNLTLALTATSLALSCVSWISAQEPLNPELKLASVPVRSETLMSSRVLEVPRHFVIQEVNELTQESPSDATEEVRPSDQDSLTPLQSKELTTEVQIVDISLDGLGTGAMPEVDSNPHATGKVLLPDGGSRGAAYQCVHWRASLVHHQPLRYEDAMLERHGHRRFGCFQPVASGIKFFATIPMIPYLSALRPGCECQYELGNYRPGTCAPLLRDNIPYDRRAAITEALAIGAFFWAIPQ